MYHNKKIERRGDLEPSKHPAIDVEQATLNMPRINSCTWDVIQAAGRVSPVQRISHLLFISGLSRTHRTYDRDFQTRVRQDNNNIAGYMIMPIEQVVIRDKMLCFYLMLIGRPKPSPQLVKS